MNALLRTGAALLCFSSLCQSGAAQQPVGQNAPIQLDVIVTDKSGKAVAGLGQADFTVLDNKHPVPIQSFQAHSAAALPVSRIDASTEVIIILDEANTPFERAIDARLGIETFLKQNGGNLTHPFSVGFLTDGGLELQTEPSVDGNALAAAIAQRGQPRRTIDNGTQYGRSDRLQVSQNALDALIKGELPKPGRKMVLWVSPGWPLLSGMRAQLSDRQEQMVLSRAVLLSSGLRQARITMYSIDTLGTTGERTAYYQNFTDPLTKLHDAQFGDLSLQVLVTQTGGGPIFGSDLVQNSLNRCMADLNAFYTISIDPATANRPLDFHTLEVKIETPGLKARTRNGYYAQR